MPGKAIKTDARFNDCPDCGERVVLHQWEALHFKNVYALVGFCKCGNVFTSSGYPQFKYSGKYSGKRRGNKILDFQFWFKTGDKLSDITKREEELKKRK